VNFGSSGCGREAFIVKIGGLLKSLISEPPREWEFTRCPRFEAKGNFLETLRGHISGSYPDNFQGWGYGKSKPSLLSLALVKGWWLPFYLIVVIVIFFQASNTFLI